MARQHIEIHCTPEANAADFRAAARTARELLIARLARLHARALRNFDEALFAHRIADSARDSAPALSDARRQAAKLCTKALRSMEHWHKRSHALAMAEIRVSTKPMSGGLDVC